MALPEGTKLRKGDIVAIHATVEFDFDPQRDDFAFLDIAGQTRSLIPHNIVGIVRRVFKPGEVVRVVDQGYRFWKKSFTVEAISESGEKLWVRDALGQYDTVSARDVELVEDKAGAETAEATQ